MRASAKRVCSLLKMGVRMRIDPDHIKKLARAISTINGERRVQLDVAHLHSCMGRLSLWEGGLLMDALMRAAQARKLSREQRVLLALFVHDEDAVADDATSDDAARLAPEVPHGL